MIPTRDVAPRALGELLKRQPNSEAKVRFAWRSCVGESMTRATSIRLESTGILQVRVETEAWRHEVSRSIPIIRRRLGDLLGPSTVKRIVVKRNAS